jgi:hypothetical protein
MSVTTRLRLLALCAALVAVSGCGAARPACEGRCETAVPPKSRRILLEPADVAVIARGFRQGGVLPSSLTLGRKGDGDRALLLRFDIPPEVDVLAAYVLVDLRGVDVDGAGVGLVAERILEPWSAASATWLDGPELEGARAATLVLGRGGPSRVRLDAGFLAGRDVARAGGHGIAIAADRATDTGAVVAVTPEVGSPLAGDGLPGRRSRGPRLELYVK